jgi:undecaprenyl diphosphate synthase
VKINHLGIIPDGNRRWAKQNNITLFEVYDVFANKIVKLTEFLQKSELNALTIYLASKENLTRTDEEVKPVVDALLRVLPNILQTAMQNDYRVTFPGIYNVNHKTLVDTINDVQEKTKNNGGKKLYLLTGYNPIDEINRSRNLYNPLKISDLEVDLPLELVIRTGGKPVRLSNFLPLQCGYANIEVFDKFFIDLTEEDILQTVRSYEAVTPNYGK